MAKRVEQLMGRASSIEKLVHFFQHMYKGPVATRSTLGYLTTRAKETSLSEESESREKGVKLNLTHRQRGERRKNLTWRYNRELPL
jgi:hypothetical protein